jgi:sirohydrochlorin cobaltochelatase
LVDGFEKMTSPMTPLGGVILFAHGSRDPLWRLPIDAVAELMRSQHPSLPVAVAFLELTNPDMPHTVEALMKQGVAHLRIVPMFLGVGRHAREDLPELLTQLRTQYPDLVFQLMPAVGEDPEVVNMLAAVALKGL